MTEIANDWPATPAGTAGHELAVFLEEARKRYRRAGNSPDMARNLETWIDSANDVPRLLAEVTRLRGELAEVRKFCTDDPRTAGSLVAADILAILNPDTPAPSPEGDQA